MPAIVGRFISCQLRIMPRQALETYLRFRPKASLIQGRGQAHFSLVIL